MATLRAMPVLQVRDLARAEAFWRRLGFESHGAWGEPPSFAVMQRGDVTIALDRGEGPVPLNQWWAAYVYVDDVDALAAELAAAGVATSPPQDRGYGMRDFDVVDPDGHRIAFGADLAPGPHPPGLGPERGRG